MGKEESIKVVSFAVRNSPICLGKGTLNGTIEIEVGIRQRKMSTAELSSSAYVCNIEIISGRRATGSPDFWLPSEDVKNSITLGDIETQTARRPRRAAPRRAAPSTNTDKQSDGAGADRLRCAEGPRKITMAQDKNYTLHVTGRLRGAHSKRGGYG